MVFSLAKALISFAISITLPPPIATITSHSDSKNCFTPAKESSYLGLLSNSENRI